MHNWQCSLQTVSILSVNTQCFFKISTEGSIFDTVNLVGIVKYKFNFNIIWSTQINNQMACVAVIISVPKSKYHVFWAVDFFKFLSEVMS